MNSSTRARAVALILILLASGVPAALAADATATGLPPLDIPEVALKGMLLKTHVDMIIGRLQFYADMIRNAKTQAEIDKGRVGLVRTFKYSPHASYRYTVAQKAVKIVTPLLDLPNSAKQISAAIALSEMPQVTIQPALDKMVKHSSPAVRYIGWKGYRAAWVPIVQQGATPAKAMFAILKDRAKKEYASPVVGVIWEMLMLRGTVTSTPESLGSLDDLGLSIVTETWPRQCWKIRKGSAEMADAGLKGLATAVEYAANAMAAKNKKNTTAAMQLIADLMWYSAKGYGDAYKAGNSGKLVVHANTLLLLECERSLNHLLEFGALNRKDYLRAPLTRKSFGKGRGAKVMFHIGPKQKYGVLAWVDELKARFGIKTPSAARLAPKPAATTTKTKTKKSATSPAKGK